MSRDIEWYRSAAHHGANPAAASNAIAVALTLRIVGVAAEV